MLVLKIILLLVACVLFAVLLYILFIPVRFRLDTDEGTGRLTWGPLLEGELGWKANEPEPRLLVHAAWWHRQWSATELLRMNPKNSGKKQEKTSRKNAPKGSMWPSFRRIRELLLSFHCREFVWELDTDDFILDALLFPVGFFLSQNGYDIRINFMGRNRLLVDMDNTGARLLYHFFKPLKH
ncbi:MAG: hypothetical protein H6548_00640 [Chitinophagales bacterium]|nr:hypothetical protein [Chitinophagales bacterium]MCB9020605.1 hypothetical protein [Chitinophagales bacterium]